MSPTLSSRPKVAYVTCEPRQAEWEDDLLSAERPRIARYEVEFRRLGRSRTPTGPAYDLVVVRSPWDYADRLEEFLAWAESVGPEKLRNAPEILRWNTDKRYLAELDGGRTAGATDDARSPRTVPVPDFGGKVVIKPVDRGRRPDHRRLQRRLARRAPSNCSTGSATRTRSR